MLKTNLEKISEELSRYRDQSRQELFQNCISNKLKHTLDMYEADIQETTDFLYKAESARVLKTLVKIQKKSDKQAIIDSLEEESEDVENE